MCSVVCYYICSSTISKIEIKNTKQLYEHILYLQELQKKYLHWMIWY
jgi:hypothetical protein